MSVPGEQPGDGWSTPGADDAPRPSPRRPRNFLERGEHRRLLWRVMPLGLALFLGLTILERTWWRPARSAAQRPVDTTLEAVRGPRPTGDEVVIEADEQPFEPAAGALGAPVSALRQVRDDTFFRAGDTEAWEQTLLTLREAGLEGLAKAPAQRVSFSELFGQPRSFRGRLVGMRGRLRRLEELRAPENHYGFATYWQGWLAPEGASSSPVVVHFLRLPQGMPTGLEIDEPVDVKGYFLKRYAYNAADTIRLAPLIVALEPDWRPLPKPPAGGSSLGTWAIVTMAALVAATLAGIRLAGRGRGPQPAAPVDLGAALEGFEPEGEEARWRRVAEAARRSEEHPT